MKWLLLILLLCTSVIGATLTGTVYDSSLNKVSKAIVEINYPQQRDVIENGTYYFELSPGVYNLSVYLSEGARQESTTETILIEKEQNYVFDLFLFEDLSDEETLEVPEIVIEEERQSNISTILIFGFLIMIGLLLYLMKPNKKNEEGLSRMNSLNNNEDVLKNKMLKIINEEKRISQKDLRKLIPYSEAKVSMVISELEAEGKIIKIKKGRTNFIVVKN